MLGVVIVGINSDQLYDYGAGIWDGIDAVSGKNCDPNDVDHAVAIVGYGRNSTINVNYWIIKYVDFFFHKLNIFLLELNE